MFEWWTHPLIQISVADLRMTNAKGFKPVLHTLNKCSRPWSEKFNGWSLCWAFQPTTTYPPLTVLRWEKSPSLSSDERIRNRSPSCHLTQARTSPDSKHHFNWGPPRLRLFLIKSHSPTRAHRPSPPETLIVRRALHSQIFHPFERFRSARYFIISKSFSNTRNRRVTPTSTRYRLHDILFSASRGTRQSSPDGHIQNFHCISH